MVGIVIVSHSKKLGGEIIKLCKELKKSEFKIINGGGLETENFGSNPLNIKRAIQEAYSPYGVLIFGDLGSSIENAKLAIDLIEDEKFNKDIIKIANAPIVEGAIVATSVNSEGTTLAEIQEELKEIENYNKI